MDQAPGLGYGLDPYGLDPHGLNEYIFRYVESRRTKVIPKLNYRAIRAYNKIYAPIAKRQWFGSQCDYQVDFGEWSSSAYYHISETIEERIAEYVGARFGLSAEELRHQVWIADNIHNDCYFARKLGERVGLVSVQGWLTRSKL